MLNRSLFEGMAVAHWVHSHPEEAEKRFMEAKRMNAHLAAKLVEQLDWDSEVDRESLTEARLDGAELDEFQAKFGEHGERLWTGPGTLPKLLRAIEHQWDQAGRKQLWRFYEVVNRDNNQLLHSTVLGLTRAYSGQSEDGGRVWIGPSLVHIDQALFGAFWIYAQVLTLFTDRFELDDPEGLKTGINDLIGRFRKT